MQNPEADAALRHQFQTRARKIRKIKSRYLVPLKYDTDGKLLNSETPDVKKLTRLLSLADWKFLECWRRNNWDTDKTRDELKYTVIQVKRLVNRVNLFRDEEIKDKALATIPSTAWVQARHVENVFSDGKLGDSERDSLKELAKITGAYKSTTQINIQQNVFQKPMLSAEQEKATREFFDTIAIETPAP